MDEEKTGTKLTLGEKAYLQIKQKLIMAEYEPGQFLQEAQIASELGLGRTPVHNALHRLKQEGLVDIIPRKGVIVQTDSLSEIYLALETRLLVEPHCAGLCAERRTSEDLVRLTAVCELQENGKEKTKQELMELDRRFHSRIARAAGNHLLSDFLGMVHDRMSRIWFLPTWHFHDFDMTNDEHRAILNAIEARDAQAARAAMAAHVHSLRKRIMEASPG